AGRAIALLAERGQEGDFHLAAVRLDRALDPEPGEAASLLRRFWPRYRKVVLRIAGDDAGLASRAVIQVDGHRPAVHRMGRRRSHPVRVLLGRVLVTDSLVVTMLVAVMVLLARGDARGGRSEERRVGK